MAIRSGRLKIASAARETITIIKGRSGAFYRIFNSGDKAFTVKPNRLGVQDDTITLKPTFSVDVVVGDEVVVEASEATEGIYEYLDTQNPVRSGRFKIKQVSQDGNPVVNPAYPHLIIDLRKGSDKAWYRIFNSGENNIVLLSGSKNPEPLKTLGKEQSFDFEVGSLFKEVCVTSEDSIKPIEGIYEFLGKGD